MTISYLYSAESIIQRCGTGGNRLHSHPVTVSRKLAKYDLVNRYQWEQDYGRQVAEQIRRRTAGCSNLCQHSAQFQKIMIQASEAAGFQFIFWFQDAISLAMGSVLRKKIPVVGGWRRQVLSDHGTKHFVE